MTGIQWTEETWNPVTGCSKVSPGCAHCYAELIAQRFWKTQYPPILPDMPDDPFTSRPREFTDVQCHDDRLDAPLRRRKPTTYFVNSMSDLFHEDVPDQFIDRVFAVMALATRHTFQILTKRAARMRDYLANLDRPTLIARQISEMPLKRPYTWETARSIIFGIKLSEAPPPSRWPLPNVWLGVSVENQHFADERIPLLLQTPAAVRFISAEPLLAPIDLTDVGDCINALDDSDAPLGTPFLDWVIVGGESGAGARPFDVAWARAIVAQCYAAGVPVFVKQLGGDPRDRNDAGFEGDTPTSWPMDTNTIDECSRPFQGDLLRVRLRDRSGGNPDEWPEDLRVRETPAL